jgi:hypothetical protein
MKIMLKHSSATVREQTPHATEQAPHVTETTRTATIINALKRRALAVLNDESIDAQSRAIIRYGLETNDPWLAELVRRADAGERIVDTIDFTQTPDTAVDDSIEDKIEALIELICRSRDESATKSAALLVLMATVENSPHSKGLASVAKQLAFTRCSELNLCGMVDAQIAIVESELLAGNSLMT